MKLCGKCKENKPREAFYAASRYADGLISPCIECRRKLYEENREARLAKMKEYSAKNAETARQRSKKWRNDNKDKRARQHNNRRAMKRKVAWERYSEDEVISLHGTQCHLCGGEIDMNANRKPGADGWEKGLHIDHVVDLSRGGSDTLDNVKPSHGICNLRKPKAKRLTEL